MRMLAVTYYGKRHLTSGSKAVKTRRRHGGLQAARAAGRHLPRHGGGLGRAATPVNFNELYLALSQGAVDGQENPLPTIQSAKLNEVQKFLVLTGHIITPRLVIANDEFLAEALGDADRGILETAIKNGAAWQDKELVGRKASSSTPARRPA